jgi:uncharacterized HAD superfamily protein
MAIGRLEMEQLASLARRAARATHLDQHADLNSAEKTFEKFLLSEYEHIAHAHFNTVVSLANFFKHYIAIVSVPFVVIGLVLNWDSERKAGIMEFLGAHPFLPLTSFFAVALIGFLVMVYAIHIRCDAILYARTVNGIRKYFYGKSPLPLSEQRQVRGLPTTTALPSYMEPLYFGTVVLTFALVGTIYFAVGLYFGFRAQSCSYGAYYWSAVGAFFGLHLVAYKKVTDYREYAYLRSHAIGIDIDGVLNNHCRQFADVLKSQVHKTIDPDSISRIPVHEIPGIDVTEADEQAVFNWPAYWREMPTIQPDVGSLVTKLRNALGYRVWIFSRRGWPAESRFPTGKEREYWCAWVSASWWTILQRFAFVKRVDAWLDRLHLPVIARGRAINALTERWLNKHHIPYDKLVIERSNTDRKDLRSLKTNRFSVAKRQHFRAFVEDDIANARKLADTCEVVFLIDQPYNRCGPGELPSNVVRVESWNELFRTMRDTF